MVLVVNIYIHYSFNLLYANPDFNLGLRISGLGVGVPSSRNLDTFIDSNPEASKSPKP